MKVNLMECPAFPEELCGAAAATCTESENYERSLHHALESGHTSVLEHASFTFMVEGLSRAAMAQLTRHRLASFDVQSQRYVKLDNWKAVIPNSVATSGLAIEAEDCIRNCMDIYQRLVEAGVPCEDARYVTPQAITTSLVMTMNARELLHFFSLRTCNRAQWEIRALATEMHRQCMKVAPALFRDAGPGCLRGACPEGTKSCGKALEIKKQRKRLLEELTSEENDHN